MPEPHAARESLVYSTAVGSRECTEAAHSSWVRRHQPCEQELWCDYYYSLLTTEVVLFIFVIVVIFKTVTWLILCLTDPPLSCMFTYEMYFLWDVFCCVCSFVLTSPFNSLPLFSKSQWWCLKRRQCSGQSKVCEMHFQASVLPAEWLRNLWHDPATGLWVFLSFSLSGYTCSWWQKHHISVMILSHVFTQSGLTHDDFFLFRNNLHLSVHAERSNWDLEKGTVSTQSLWWREDCEAMLPDVFQPLTLLSVLPSDIERWYLAVDE